MRACGRILRLEKRHLAGGDDAVREDVLRSDSEARNADKVIDL